MIRVLVFRAAVTALLLSGTCAAAAGPDQTTQFSSYSVSGRSPAEIYRSILARGPTVGGTKAIAATNARIAQNYNVVQGASTCRVTDYRLSFRFNVLLPRLTTLKSLPQTDRILWQQFTVFLKAHELQHTRLWLTCAADLQRKVESIAASSCKDATRKAEALWRKMKASCDKQQVNFDKEQRSELAAQPFMQRVIRGD